MLQLHFYNLCLNLIHSVQKNELKIHKKIYFKTILDCIKIKRELLWLTSTSYREWAFCYEPKQIC